MVLQEPVQVEAEDMSTVPANSLPLGAGGQGTYLGYLRLLWEIPKVWFGTLPRKQDQVEECCSYGTYGIWYARYVWNKLCSDIGQSVDVGRDIGRSLANIQ